MLKTCGPILQTILGTALTWGLTAAGAGLVVIFNGTQQKLLDASLGFAAGVMLAASYWSLLEPAIEMAEQSGQYGDNGEYSFIPVAVGFLVGAVFVYSADVWISLLGIDSPNLIKELASNNISQRKRLYSGGEEGITSFEGYHEKSISNSVSRKRTVGKPSEAQNEISYNGYEASSTLQFSKAKWKKMLMLIIAITVHNIPEGLAVGVAFGAIGSSSSATFESARYGIHRNTISFKLREEASLLTPKKTGGQTALSQEEEEVIVSHLIALASYGFPVTSLELRLLVKSYLARIDRKVPKFKDNLPGSDWAHSFLKRHKSQLSQRTSQNISRSRAGLDRNAINSFFDHLEAEIDGVAPENIWNYDESNLQDDPGSKKIIVKRGAKHPEIIKNATKASVSIMMCGNGVGSMVPVYVTYKADGLYQCWMEGGPKGARYNRSKSGWFDSFIFEDWFEFLLLPVLKKQNGTKVLIGDNLSSHLSYRVLSLCQENNIKFIALPPHSTHLLQPLDVAFFRPMKGTWRSVVTKWKETDEGRKLSTVPKTVFPRLLNDMMEQLDERASTNMKAGFKACGIHPLNRDVVLKKLCGEVFQTSGDHIQNVSQAFLAELQTKRDETCLKKTTRRKKLQVPPGRGISLEDIPVVPVQVPVVISSPAELGQPSSSKDCDKNKQKRKDVSKKKPKRQTRVEVISTSEEDDDNIVFVESDDSIGSLASMPHHDSFDEIDFADSPSDKARFDQHDPGYHNEGHSRNYNQDPHNTPAITTTGDQEIKSGDYVAVQYKNKVYPGIMNTGFDAAGDACISAMARKGKSWIWPNPPAILWYKKAQVLRKIPAPQKIGEKLCVQLHI